MPHIDSFSDQALREAKAREAKKDSYAREINDLFIRMEEELLPRMVRWYEAEINKMTDINPFLLPGKLDRNKIINDNLFRFLFGKIDLEKVQRFSKGMGTDKRRDGFRQELDKTIRLQVIETYRDHLGQLNSNFNDAFENVEGIRVKRVLTDKLAIEKLLNNEVFGKKFPEYNKAITELYFDQLPPQVNSAVARGITLGESTPQIAKRIEKILKPVIIGSTRSLRRRAEQISRDFTQEAYNRAEIDFLKQQERLISGITVRETLDRRTCLQCAARDGKTKPKPECFIAPWIQAHSRCRMFIETEFNENTSNKVRAAKDAEIKKGRSGDRIVDLKTKQAEFPAQNAYSKWFKQQSVPVRRKILGPGRFNLMTKNKLDIDDMVFKSGPRRGQVKTLKELERSVKRKKS